MVYVGHRLRYPVKRLQIFTIQRRLSLSLTSLRRSDFARVRILVVS